jgi:hypothetical protein
MFSVVSYTCNPQQYANIRSVAMEMQQYCVRYMSLLNVVMVTQTMVSLFYCCRPTIYFVPLSTVGPHAHGRKDTAMLIRAFCDHANAPKNGTL